VTAANRLTDDGIRGVLDKLLGSHRHHAGTITGVPQGSQQRNVGTITGGASPITDPGPASLGNVSKSPVVTRTPARPVRGSSFGEGGRPASLSGGMSHPTASSTLHKLLGAVVRHHLRSPRRGGGYVGVTGGYSPTLTPPPIREVTEPVLPEILAPEGSVSVQPPPSLNDAAQGIGLTSPRPSNAAAYPYPPFRTTRIIVSLRCACGARRCVEATDHHKARPPATFVCAICTTRLARVA
jgi:hypothetical protein